MARPELGCIVRTGVGMTAPGLSTCNTDGCTNKAERGRRGLCGKCAEIKRSKWQRDTCITDGCNYKPAPYRGGYCAQCVARRNTALRMGTHGDTRSRCPSCEAVLAYVENNGVVCNMKRCQDEAVRLRLSKPLVGVHDEPA